MLGNPPNIHPSHPFKTGWWASLGTCGMNRSFVPPSFLQVLPLRPKKQPLRKDARPVGREFTVGFFGGTFDG